MVVDYLSSQLDWAGYQVSTKWGSGPPYRWDCPEHRKFGVGTLSPADRQGPLVAYRYREGGHLRCLGPDQVRVLLPRQKSLRRLGVSPGWPAVTAFRLPHALGPSTSVFPGCASSGGRPATAPQILPLPDAAMPLVEDPQPIPTHCLDLIHVEGQTSTAKTRQARSDQPDRHITMSSEQGGVHCARKPHH